MVRRVLAVTLEQLAAQGFQRLSVPEIAARTGLNKTSIYRRWPTKTDLVRDALNVSMGHGAELPDTGALRSDLLEMARAALSFVQSPLGTAVLRTLVAEEPDSEMRGIASSMLQQEGDGPQALLRRAMTRGELPPDADVELILTAVAGALMQRIFIEGSPVPDVFLQRLIDLVLLGAVSRR